MRNSPSMSARTRSFVLALIDASFCVLVNLAYLVLTRFAYSIPSVGGFWVYLFNAVLLIFLTVLFRIISGNYRNIWRFTNTRASFFLILSDGAACVVAWAISRCLSLSIGVLYFVTVAAVSCLFSLAARFAYRLWYKHRRQKNHPKLSGRIRVAIIGAGQMGANLVTELQGNVHSNYSPVCFIDVDKSKIGSLLFGLPVYGESEAEKVFAEYGIQEVIVAVGRGEESVNEIYQHYSSLGCRVKVYDLPIQEKAHHSGENATRVIRDFSIEDLLFRKPMAFDNGAVSEYRDKTILVTGGGGSIGSELCRQIAQCHPKKLIIFDIYENNAYDIQQELTRNYGDSLDLAVEIGSVRDRDRLDCVFSAYRPDVVFHAAAHKHVPLMEHSGCEAIKNNVFGTYNTADMAEKYGAGRFVLISTDKAVNPTNIMGASKRLCEMIVQCRTDSKTCFTAVRFGNVLGSNGSVIPLFKRQIQNGGPITITDKNIIRYFMTIPEASQLVMQAGTLAKRGELFVLNMGRPVKIYDLAVNMIRLMGYEPDVDIKIEEIGLRPGEKLYEELLMKSENQIATESNMIFIEKDTPLTRAQVEDKLALLRNAVESSKSQLQSEAIRAAVKATVPTFVDPEEVNRKAESSDEMKLAEGKE